MHWSWLIPTIFWSFVAGLLLSPWLAKVLGW